mmetsp:Transcript_47564/g.116557  ORF Transcript_47564/g.116557 Transcript_47564/m.116557 type:complete len:154 (+) Transcript_47564:68-529(+)|eukprot:CAMPEP_0198337480 /NCGR_PEP_ID=MMETSP1450-20131203/28658_1 /TAXON_ID=753684 ORGANISM="Madagascaria erythrocladiodes, Strain CCMP3234" /NCGR_SAMPLE_ID=MMETSP1450 /ASSEMBLY_ACC=CAM_ASM_001115 /LENGTH=153 /DNA_ID=CAMNT_0044042287 /DNA_START=67 /DNA_END=528 /DNA_ORIENTATION=+
MSLFSILFSMPVFWVLMLLACGALIFLAVYYLVSLTDLESDLQNPIDMCRRANQCVLPEIGGHLVLCALFLITGNWVEFLVNVPLAAWNVKAVLDHKHLFDATSIFQDLPRHKTIQFAKLGYQMLFFFLLLFRLVTSLIALSNYSRRRYPTDY